MLPLPVLLLYLLQGLAPCVFSVSHFSFAKLLCLIVLLLGCRVSLLLYSAYLNTSCKMGYAPACLAAGTILEV